VNASSPAAEAAQERLLKRLRENVEEIDRVYSRSNAPAKDEYWIHDAKFTQELGKYLLEKKLAWSSHDPYAVGFRSWVALHPILGSAIMTTLGLSIAEEQNYDIVTESKKYHETLLANTEDAVFEKLLFGKKQTTLRTSQARHDLGQLVVTLTGVNLSALEPESIARLQASKHFQAFQRLIRSRAWRVDAGAEVHDYHDQLNEEAGEIIAAWRDASIGLSEELKSVLYDESRMASKLALKEAVTGLKAEEVLIEAGVAVAFQVVKRVIREIRGPKESAYRYLTEVVGAQSDSLRLTYPLGLER
jgi:hypothetical protein